MARILTGIQSSGKPHLGNLLGAILPAIALSKDEKNESFFFIADLHSLTTIKDAEIRKNNTLSVAAAWIACGFDTDKNLFYRQSKVPQVCELAWYLNCFTPFPMLANAHSFKDKSDKLSDVNAGLFTYPVLMTADIILYDANIVPVGKDQKQHLEMARDIASTFNTKYGETFVIPEARIDENMMTIPGTDGLKMSKSYGNTIDIFQDEKPLKKNIQAIITDSAPLEEPKNPDTCNVFFLYQLLGNENQIADLRAKYLAGNFGYGHAKQALFELILDVFKEPREIYKYLMENPSELEKRLQDGEIKAAKIANKTMARIKEKLGF
ncbi:MAG: tryptophanyl-tRNA synthetase [Cyclobacteriaceae bacterium]|jgi:tryptophanyl-tRNA synthetase